MILWAPETNYEAVEVELMPLELDIPMTIFSDDSEYIRITRNGISGRVVQKAINAYGHRDLFTRLLETSSTNLSRVYKKKALEEGVSEKVLDTIHLFLRAESVFGDMNTANEWINCRIPALGDNKPIELFDTFKGRELVEHALRKIEYGEFV